MWALGDYHRFAKELVWEIGPVVVEACGIGPGQRVLDVAAGTGNVAIRAAEAGATVVASDITPEHFAAGRREASDARRRARMGAGRRAGAPVRRRRVRRRDLVVRRDLRARTTRRWRTSWCACAVPAARSGWPTSRRRVSRPTSSASSRRTRRRRRRERSRRCSGAARSTCASCSATASNRSELTRAEYVERAAEPARLLASSSSRRSGRRSRPSRAWRTSRSAPRRWTASSWNSPSGRTAARPDGPAEYVYEYLLVVARKRER